VNQKELEDLKRWTDKAANVVGDVLKNVDDAVSAKSFYPIRSSVNDLHYAIGELLKVRSRVTLTLEHMNKPDCPAVMHHGPGHQSKARCSYKEGHVTPDDPFHWADNPMCPGFEWEGDDGWQY
jgi:hypothetical protein